MKHVLDRLSSVPVVGIVEEHMGLAVHIAKRYNVRAGRDDDIEQVAMLALVKAVDRFDPSVGVPFAAFAGRTIEGEIKRHFRDATWSIKVPAEDRITIIEQLYKTGKLHAKLIIDTRGVYLDPMPNIVRA